MRSAPWLLVVLLTSCSVAPPPADSFYRLDLPASRVLARPALQGVVEVSRFSAEGLTGERALLYSYRGRPEQVLRYSYHFWTAAPPALLQDQLVEVLRSAQVAPTVVTSDINVPANYVIEGRIRRLEQVAGASPAVVVELDLDVVRIAGSELVMFKTYRVEEPTRSERPADAVAAFGVAVGELFGRFVDDLSQLTVKR